MPYCWEARDEWRATAEEGREWMQESCGGAGPDRSAAAGLYEGGELLDERDDGAAAGFAAECEHGNEHKELLQ